MPKAITKNSRMVMTCTPVHQADRVDADSCGAHQVHDEPDTDQRVAEA